MKMASARRVAREMSSAGYQFVRIVEELESKCVTVEAINSCGQHRCVQSERDWEDLRRRESW